MLDTWPDKNETCNGNCDGCNTCPKCNNKDCKCTC